MALTLSNILNIFATPTEVFKNIKTVPKWITAFFVICVVDIICGYLSFPFMNKVMEATLTTKMSDEQVQQALSSMARFRYFWILAAIVIVLIKWSFISLFLYLGAILFDAQQNNYKTIYAVVVYSDLILLLLRIFNVLILFLKGIDAVHSMTDLQAIIGLDHFLVNKSQNIPLATLLNQFNIFSVWYVATLTIGMSIVGELKKWKSAVLVSSVWLIGVGFQFAFSLLSQNIQHMMGK